MIKYHAPTIFIFIVFSLLTVGCSKQEKSNQTIEHAEADKTTNTKQVSIERLKIDTIKKMYKEEISTQKGNEVLYKYSTKNFKDIFDKSKNALDSGCGIDDNILMQSQDPDYENLKLEFSIDDLGLVNVNFDNKEPLAFELKCNNGICEVDEVLTNNRSLILEKEACIEIYNDRVNQENNTNIEEQNLPTPQLRYELYKEPQTLNGTTIYKTFIKILSMEDNIKVSSLNINRGRCSYEHFWGRSSINYGDSVTYYVHCPLENILEVEIKLTDGRSFISQR